MKKILKARIKSKILRKIKSNQAVKAEDDISSFVQEVEDAWMNIEGGMSMLIEALENGIRDYPEYNEYAGLDDALQFLKTKGEEAIYKALMLEGRVPTGETIEQGYEDFLANL